VASYQLWRCRQNKYPVSTNHDRRKLTYRTPAFSTPDGDTDEDVLGRISRLLSVSQDQQHARKDYDSLREIFADHSRHVLIAALDYLARKVISLEERLTTLEANDPRRQTRPPSLLNCKAACDLLEMHPDTLNKYRKMGKIRALRMGKGFMYELSDLLKLAGRKA